jgi:hypothetical protein
MTPAANGGTPVAVPRRLALAGFVARAPGFPRVTASEGEIRLIGPCARADKLPVLMLLAGS